MHKILPVHGDSSDIILFELRFTMIADMVTATKQKFEIWLIALNKEKYKQNKNTQNLNKVQ